MPAGFCRAQSESQRCCRVWAPHPRRKPQPGLHHPLPSLLCKTQMATRKASNTIGELSRAGLRPWQRDSAPAQRTSLPAPLTPPPPHPAQRGAPGKSPPRPASPSLQIFFPKKARNFGVLWECTQSDGFSKQGKGEKMHLDHKPPACTRSEECPKALFLRFQPPL